MKRIAIGGIVDEINTFAPMLTSLEAFSQGDGNGITERWRGSYSSMGGVIQGVENAYDVIEIKSSIASCLYGHEGATPRSYIGSTQSSSLAGSTSWMLMSNLRWL